MPIVNGLTISPYTALYTSLVADSVTTAAASNREGRTAIVLDFNSGSGLFSRDLETAFSWDIASGIILYSWQPTLLSLPENTYNRATDWIECGGGTGFIQGIIIEADTFNVPKVFQLQDSDTLVLHPLNEVGSGVAFNRQSVIAFSCTPFIAHSVRVVTTDGVPWRVWRNQLVYVPFPEQTQLWQSELTAANGVGWQHLREFNVEYIASAVITLTFSVDTGNGSYAPLAVTIPSSSGLQTKLRLTLTPNKWKLIGMAASSVQPFFLFLEGMELKIRSWGSDQGYRVERPFGGNSKMAAVV